MPLEPDVPLEPEEPDEPLEPDVPLEPEVPFAAVFLPIVFPSELKTKISVEVSVGKSATSK